MDNPDTQARQLTGTVRPEQAGQRLDQVLAQLFSDYSRSRLQQWIKQDRVLLDGRSCRAKDKVYGGECVEIYARLDDQVACHPQDIALDVVFEDESLLVIKEPKSGSNQPKSGSNLGIIGDALHYPK